MGEGEMICCTAFDRDDEFFATAGVSRRIKACSCFCPMAPEYALGHMLACNLVVSQVRKKVLC